MPAPDPFLRHVLAAADDLAGGTDPAALLRRLRGRFGADAPAREVFLRAWVAWFDAGAGRAA